MRLPLQSYLPSIMMFEDGMSLVLPMVMMVAVGHIKLFNAILRPSHLPSG
jgi:hypothetical protein